MRALIIALLLCAPLAAEDKPPSWWWVHAGVAAHAIGSSADGYTSWERIEWNPIPRERTGQMQGRFYRVGVGVKATDFAISTAAAYLIARKWPGTRKWIGIIGIGRGAVYGGIAVRNELTRK
jgi:hypothetical protein